MADKRIEMFDVYNDTACRPELWTLNYVKGTITIITVDETGRAHTERLTDVCEEDMRIQRKQLREEAAKQREVERYPLRQVFGR